MRDLKLIEIDLIDCRDKYKKLMEFMKDKPFMRDQFEFIIKTLKDKIEWLEDVNKSQSKELKMIDKELSLMEFVQEKKPIDKTEIVKQFWFGLQRHRDLVRMQKEIMIRSEK